MEPPSQKIISYQYSITTFLFSCAIAVRQLTFSPITFFEIAVNRALRYKHVCPSGYVIKPNTKSRLEVMHHIFVVKTRDS